MGDRQLKKDISKLLKHMEVSEVTSVIKLRYPTLIFYAQDEKKIKLEPKKDITPYESVKVTELMIYVLGMHLTGEINIGVDYYKYVKDHGIERHFVEFKE